jgi:hypothetical protein
MKFVAFLPSLRRRRTHMAVEPLETMFVAEVLTQAVTPIIEKRVRRELEKYLDGLTAEAGEPHSYRDGWNDCREDVARFFAILEEEEGRG